MNKHLQAEQPRICVCIPAYDQVYAYFADRLAKLFLRAGKLGFDIHLKIRSGSDLARNRNELVKDAIQLAEQSYPSEVQHT